MVSPWLGYITTVKIVFGVDVTSSSLLDKKETYKYVPVTRE